MKTRTCILKLPFNEGEGHPDDSSGYDNNGTNTNATWEHGDFGWAMRFTSNTHIDCGASDSLNNLRDGFTIKSWFKPDVGSGLGVVTYDIEYVRCYAAGVASGTPYAYTSEIVATDRTINIGRRKPNNYHFVGLITMVDVYNEPFSPTRIIDDYNDEKGRFGL